MSDPKAYVHAATSFQLSSWRYLFAFLRASGKVQQVLRRTPGFVTYKLRADFFRATFRTYTIFESYEALQDLVYSPEHAHAMAKAAVWSGPESRTTSWTSPSTEIDWTDALRRLEAATPYQQKQAPAGSKPQTS